MGFFPRSVTVSVEQALNERPGGVPWGEQGGSRLKRGPERDFCKQVVYLHPVKHLLAFSWEIGDVLQSLEEFINQIFGFEFVFITTSTPPVCFALHRDVRISQRWLL